MDLSWTLGRNNSGQITSISVNDGAFLARPVSTKSDTYVPNGLNQIKTLNGSALSYDANGNLTSDGTFTFEYDEENRLRNAIGNGKTISYEYDPLGRRRLKDVSGVGITKFISDGVEEIEERDSGNTVLRRYAYGPGVDERVAMLDNAACGGGGRCFYQTNWQGSTVKLLNQANSVVETYQYGPYGERVDWSPQAPDTGNPFRYTGRRFDAETGLYFYRARYYSPKLGGFLQTDPIGTKDDLNLYAYVANDPMNRVDPSGLAGVPGGGLGVVCTGTRLCDAKMNEKRQSAATLRKKWEEAHGKPWPKDPETGGNQQVAHKTAVADGGAPNDVNNYDPKSRKDHIAEHKEAGDFKRWGARAQSKVTAGAATASATAAAERGAAAEVAGTTITKAALPVAMALISVEHPDENGVQIFMRAIGMDGMVELMKGDGRADSQDQFVQSYDNMMIHP